MAMRQDIQTQDSQYPGGIRQDHFGRDISKKYAVIYSDLWQKSPVREN